MTEELPEEEAGLEESQAEETPVEEPPLPEAPTPEVAEKVELLLRQAHLHTTRGEKSKAEDVLKEALAIAPGSTDALVAYGDLMVTRHSYKTAVSLYFLATRLAPGNVLFERKHAEAILGQALAADPLAYLARSENDIDESLVNAKTAAILSFFLPGLGQVLTGAKRPGFIMMGGWVLCWIIIVLIPNGFTGLFSLLRPVQNQPFKPEVLVPLFGALVFLLWSVADGTEKAKRAEPKKVTPPKPPVDLPY
jgi:tetratricopeptide (TPR) repeat protein